MPASRCRRSRTGASATMLRANCAMERAAIYCCVLLRPDALMAMFRLLPPDTRAPGRAGAGSPPARLGRRARLPGAQRRRRRNAADDHRAHFAAAWLGPLALRSRRGSAAPRIITAPPWDFSSEQSGAATRHGLRKSRWKWNREIGISRCAPGRALHARPEGGGWPVWFLLPAALRF